MRGVAPDATLYGYRVFSCEGSVDTEIIMQALQIPLELDAFVNEVVPVLQSRGVFRTDYRGSTLRAHLDLPAAA